MDQSHPFLAQPSSQVRSELAEVVPGKLKSGEKELPLLFAAREYDPSRKLPSALTSPSAQAALMSVLRADRRCQHTFSQQPASPRRQSSHNPPSLAAGAIYILGPVC